MSSRESPSSERNFAATSLYRCYVAALLACVVGNLLIRIGDRAGWLPAWGQALVAVASAMPMLVAAGVFWRLLKRDMDEMLQRILLEGMAFAFAIYLPLSALYLNLRTAGVWVPRLDFPDLVLAPALLVAFGVWLVGRRYQ